MINATDKRNSEKSKISSYCFSAKHSHCFFHYFSLSFEHLLSGLSSLFSYGFETLRTRSSNVPPSSSGKHSLDKKSPLNSEHLPLYFPRGSFCSPSSIYSWRMRSKLATKYLQPKLCCFIFQICISWITLKKIWEVPKDFYGMHSHFHSSN